MLLLGCSGAWSRAWTKLLLRQTNSCLTQGRGQAHPFSSTHSPLHPHPVVPLHLWPHPLTPPLFYVGFNFLPPWSSKLWEKVFQDSRDKTPPKMNPRSCFHHLAFIQSRRLTSLSCSSWMFCFDCSITKLTKTDFLFNVIWPKLNYVLHPFTFKLKICLYVMFRHCILFQ